MTTVVLSILLNGNPDLERAIEQVRALDEQAAIESLIKAKSAVDNDSAELAKIHMWFGLAYAGLAREAEARESFRAALLLDETLQLPAGTSPVVTKWWKELGGGRESPKWVPGPPAPPFSAQQVSPRRWPFWTGVGLAVAGAAALTAGGYFWVQANRLRNSAEFTQGAWLAEQINREAIASAQRGNWLGGAGGFAVVFGATFLILSLSGALSSETVSAPN